MHVLGAEKCDSIAILLVSFLDISSIIMCWGLVCWSGSECWWVSVRLLELSRCKHGKESPWRTRRRHRPVYFAQQVFCVDFKLLLACVYSNIYTHIQTSTGTHPRDSPHTHTRTLTTINAAVSLSLLSKVWKGDSNKVNKTLLLLPTTTVLTSTRMCAPGFKMPLLFYWLGMRPVVVLFQGHIRRTWMALNGHLKVWENKKRIDYQNIGSGCVLDMS